MPPNPPASGDRYVCAVPDVYAELDVIGVPDVCNRDRLFFFRAFVYVNAERHSRLSPFEKQESLSAQSAAQAGDAWLRSLGWRRETKVVGV